MNITFEDIIDVMPQAVGVAEDFLPHFNKHLVAYDIDSNLKIAMFMAQIAHESGELRRLEENLNYSAKGLRNTFPKYFTEAQAREYARQPIKIANRVYGGRMGNDDEWSGDGWKYRGRGLIQITGRENYRECGAAIGASLVKHPDLLLEPEYAVLSACWFWEDRSCNFEAIHKNIIACTKKINGGDNGVADRRKYYERALQVDWLKTGK